MIRTLTLIAIASIAVVSCGRQEIYYGGYQTLFFVNDPVRTSFVRGWKEDGGVTEFYEFRMNETDYAAFAERLVANGYSGRELLDGAFGSWSVSNSSEEQVFGQSKTAPYGATYFYFEPAHDRLTAIARFTH